jgi:hypothetical protein
MTETNDLSVFMGDLERIFRYFELYIDIVTERSLNFNRESIMIVIKQNSTEKEFYSYTKNLISPKKEQ